MYASVAVDVATTGLHQLAYGENPMHVMENMLLVLEVGIQYGEPVCRGASIMYVMCTAREATMVSERKPTV